MDLELSLLLCSCRGGTVWLDPVRSTSRFEGNVGRAERELPSEDRAQGRGCTASASTAGAGYPHHSDRGRCPHALPAAFE